jgi:Mn-dependent DtxR family transcriptional regulator
MPACIRIEAEALKLRTKVAELRRLVNAGIIEAFERDGGCFLTEESASKARLTLDLLRTRKLSLTQIAQILARQAPPYRLDDVRWI